MPNLREPTASSRSPKAVVSKIPLFGTALPMPTRKSLPPPKTKAPSKLKQPHKIQVEIQTLETPGGPFVTKNDLGKRVRIESCNREGVLRYVGDVEFGSGTWCGIELADGSGKHNGVVCGRQYFTCAQHHGLMVPLNKVKLLYPIESIADCSSGPYSMIFGIDNAPSPSGDNGGNVTIISTSRSLNTTQTLIRSNTFDKIQLAPLPDTNIIQQEQEELIQNQETPFDISNQPQPAKIARRNFALDLQNIRVSPSSHLDDDSNKRDSLELEESLGILTPDQMISDLTQYRTPSSENIRLPYDNESSAVGEFSLGLIDMSNVTMNLHEVRMEQTPSPEELPLDPTPIIQDSKDKKAPNSFITSITSITSLDTGYQGDGEMSRPASRGADNSPLTRRPQPRQLPRRADPMTDSDFYTESDADNHEEHPLRGDRRAQVIDGTLYGVDAQATADLYANNRENMDSSGIFTDIERTEDISSSADNDMKESPNDRERTYVKEPMERVVELSPSESSTQTISDDSQSNINIILEKTLNPMKSVAEKPKHEVVSSKPSTNASTPTSHRSMRLNDDNNKFKMPKRNVQSKVKVMLTPNNKENTEKRVVQPKKKSPGRWDAVMNKISVPEKRKGCKEVKSRVFSTLDPNVQHGEKKATESSQSKTIPKIRRVVKASPKQTSSISSSLSDLSGASRKKPVGSAKQQREISKVNYVLNNAKIIPKNGSNEARNNANKDIKEKKKETKLKNTSGRTNVKGGLVSAIEARPPVTQTAPVKPQPPPPPVQPSPRSTEALAVLVQHLVFNLEAFNNPVLRKEVENARREAEEVRLSYRQLEEALSQEKQRHLSIIQEERMKFRSEIEKLIECHHGEVNLLNEKLKEVRVQADIEKAALVKQHENQMQGIKVELNKLQKNHDESIDILREEIEAVREENEENKDKIRHLEIYRRESDKLHLDYEAKELKLKESYEAEIARLKQEKELFLSASSDGDTTVQEVQSLRAVLDLKQVELAELRKSVAEMSQKAEQLTATEERIALLATKCEDLQHQLKCKNQSEVSLYMENKKLQDSIKEESNQKKRLIQRNEELQWRLQHNKEVFKVLEGADQSFSRSLVTSSFNERHSSCMHSTFERAMSLRERKLSTSARKSRNSLEADLDDISPPSSPKVKGVVEKSDSVSYVLEMDESPEVVASRIVRRSFRNSTSPKNTPTKSPANKRPRKNSLMQSSSVACIPSTPKEDHSRAIRTAPINQADQEFCWGATAVTSSPYSFDANIYGNGDYDEDDIEVFKLPALPSEIGRKNGNTLPVPKHMAGEAMISESASEDESSSSSSSSSRL